MTATMAALISIGLSIVGSVATFSAWCGSNGQKIKDQAVEIAELKKTLADQLCKTASHDTGIARLEEKMDNVQRDVADIKKMLDLFLERRSVTRVEK